MSEIVKKFPLTGFATLAAIAVYQGQMIAVGRARHKLKIEAPQTTGNEEFEKVFRAHQNTMESLVAFLPSLWLFALAGKNDKLAGTLGLTYALGRIAYHLGYTSTNPKKRGYGELLSFIPTFFTFGFGVYHLTKLVKNKYFK